MAFRARSSSTECYQTTHTTRGQRNDRDAEPQSKRRRSVGYHAAVSWPPITVDERPGVWSRTFRTLLTVAAAVVVLIALSLVGGATQDTAPGFHVSDDVALGAAHPQILVVFSDDASQTWIQEITVGLHLASSSASDNAPAWFFEYLDAVRFQNPRHGGQFRAALREKYRDRRLDLIVAIGSNAIDMVTRSRDEIRLDAPVLLVTYGSVVPGATRLPNSSSLVFAYCLGTALPTRQAVFTGTPTVAGGCAERPAPPA